MTFSGRGPCYPAHGTPTYFLLTYKLTQNSHSHRTKLHAVIQFQHLPLFLPVIQYHIQRAPLETVPSRAVAEESYDINNAAITRGEEIIP